MSLQSKPGPVCARCLLPIARGEHMVFESFEPVHTDCVDPTDRLVEMVAAFLRRRPDGGTCHTCLAHALRITIDETRRTTNALRLTGDYDFVVGGHCRVCHQQAPCIEPSDRAGRWPLAS